MTEVELYKALSVRRSRELSRLRARVERLRTALKDVASVDDVGLIKRVVARALEQDEDEPTSRTPRPKRKPKAKRKRKSKSIRMISGGLPSLGKRR